MACSAQYMRQNCCCIAAGCCLRADADAHTGDAHSSSAAAATPSSSAATSSTANPWSSAHPATLQRLRVLQLQGCPAALAQLAAWQAQQLAQHTASSSSDGGRPGLDCLQVLSLRCLGDVSGWLAVVLTGQALGTAAACSSSSRATAVQPWPLQHLTQLQLGHCRLRGHEAGELTVLQQLPRLQSLELAHCHLAVLPAAVCACTGLTQLSIGHNCFSRLPEGMSRLQELQVRAPTATA